jgi:outer membrane protein assembly factor BamB
MSNRLFGRPIGRHKAVGFALACAFIFGATAGDSVADQAADAHPGLAQSPWPKMLGNLRNTGSISGPPSGTPVPWLFEGLGADRAVIGSPALDADGTLYIGADSLYALDGNTGKKKWSVHFGNIFAWAPIVGYDRTLYVSKMYEFCAIDARTGETKWRFPAAKETPRAWKPEEAAVGPQNTFFGFQTAAALGADGSLYLASLEGNLYCVDSATGKERWRFFTHYQLYGSPTIDSGGTVFFTSVGTMFAVDGSTGKEKWRLPGHSIQGPPAVADDGKVLSIKGLALPDRKGQKVSLVALDSQTGDTIWEFNMGVGDARAPAIGADGTVYVGWEDTWKGPSHGKVFAIDGKTGAQKWVYDTKGGVFLAPAIGPDGVVYIGSREGVMYALNGSTGALKWQQDMGAEIGTPVAVGNNGLIYFGANDGTIYALRASDGARAPRPQ